MTEQRVTTYKLVYFQPDPEDGERVCVALLFNTSRDADVLYDPNFPRLRCLAPGLDPSLVAFFLNDLVSSLQRGGGDAESMIRRLSPQLVMSEARRAMWPLTNESRLYLMKRFLSKEGTPSPPARVAAEEKGDLVKAHIREMILTAPSRGSREFRQDADSEWVLGRKLPNIRPIAFAVRKDREVLLIDGIDLTVLTPKSALNRVGKVIHTFWQYQRLSQMGLDQRSIRRIGVVLNGVPDPGAAYQDTHDFALHQFTAEADLAVDASSAEGVRRFQEVLAD